MTSEDWRFSSAADETAMVGLALTHDAFAAIAAALPQGVDAGPVEPAAAGKVFVWLDGSLAAALGSRMTIRSLSCAFSPDVEKFADPVRRTSPSIRRSRKPWGA